MNKKFLVGFSVLSVAAAAFWACGDGDVITKGGDDELALLNYGPPFAEGDEGNMKTLLNQAMADCAADEACAAKMEGAEYVPPESSAEGGEGGEGGDTPATGSSSSKAGPVINSSAASTTPVGSSASGGNNPPPSSTAAATDPNDLSGSCKASVQSIKEGGSVTWSFTVGTLAGAGVTELLDYQNRVKAATCNWTVAGGTVTAGNVAGTCGGDGKTVTATYAEIGDYKTSIKLGEKTIDCGTVAVAGPDVTGCECAVDEANPDVKGGDVTVTWTVSGCKAGSDTPNGDWKWAWTGATGSTASATATVSKKGDTKTASVKVTSAKNASMNVPCPTVKAVNSDVPDYIIEEKDAAGKVTVPNGACVTIKIAGNLRCGHGWQNNSCEIIVNYNGSATTAVSSSTGNCNSSNADNTVAVTANSQACLEITGADSADCFVSVGW